MERAVVDIIEDDIGNHPEVETHHMKAKGNHEKVSQQNGNGTTNGHISVRPSHLSSEIADGASADSAAIGPPDAKSSKGQPMLTSAQKYMVKTLNDLPQMTKHMCYIDPVFNTHATIISRDIKHFDLHKRGWGVLRHLADNRVL